MADNGTPETAEQQAAPTRTATRKRPAAKKSEPTLSPYKLYKLDGKTMTLAVEVEASSAEEARTAADAKNKALAGVPLVVVATRNMKTLSTETETRTRVKAV
jgi:hypothetical protein